MRLVATDLDRTLLNDEGRLSDKNLRALERLKQHDFTTIIATGRNIYSARKILDSNLNFDHLIFSSGSGVLDWRKDELIFNVSLTMSDSARAVDILLKHKADFMIHDEVPDNHHFLYYDHGYNNVDFRNRISLYEEFANEWDKSEIKFPVSQILAVIPQDEMQKFDLIREELSFVKVIRTTSPLDHSTIWLEIFPSHVSKGHTLSWLCNRLGIDQKNTFSLGNDYNDIDMLEWTNQGYLVANAPDDMKSNYPHTLSNEDDGFSVWVEQILKKEN
ncbi:HAD family hydrolase [Candidatus Cloacimonadota bacterium]